MMLLRNAAVAVALASLAGCSLFGSNKSTEYKGAAARASQPLEVPPELTAPTMDDRYAIPDPRSQTSYSQYSQSQQGTPVAGGAPAVLPKVEGGRLERAGDQRWLVVKGAPEQVWPIVRQFWIDSGFSLVREEPQIGIMETEWHEDRAKIPDDFIRRTVGRVLDRMWSTPRRDKFRTRLEKGAEPNTTEIFVSNRAVEEVFTSQNQDTTKWVPLPADREQEAEMLSRLLVKVGGEETKVAAAAAKGPTPTRATQPPPAEAPKNAVLENAGAGPLVVNDGFDRAWRRVGLALDRVGFTVEDRDRSKGLFFVRYIDPDVELKPASKQSFIDKLAFWRSPPKSAQPQYRIHVADAGASASQVQVQNAQGAPETSPTGKKILALLYDQLK
ncbi:MAG: outer membrane protein assembly factor BamC [Betaproteobacteria bacterium]